MNPPLAQPPRDGDAITAVALVAVGTAAIGWIVALPDNVFASIKMALLTPAIVLGLTCALSPALYIILALTGARTAPRRFAAAVGGGLQAAGLAALGFAGPLLFLAATASSPKTAVVLGSAGLAVALIVGLVALERRAADEHTSASVLGILVWSGAALAIGCRLIVGAIA
jgi:hypothetical protein